MNDSEAGSPQSPQADDAAHAWPRDPLEQARTMAHRTRTGCWTCRKRRVKCDEMKPQCTQCRKGKRACEWPGPDDKREPRSPRRPNATACAACRDKKLKCVGNLQNACTRCSNLGIPCVRNAQQDTVSGVPRPAHPLSHASGSETTQHPTPSPGHDHGLEPNISIPARVRESEPEPETEIPVGKELESLVDLYFSSVHHFGYFSFIHQLHFHRLLVKGKAPRELTLMMIASAMRFAALPTPENLARADAWADAAIGAILPRIYQGFGAVQLMVLLLAQHYDLNRGNFTSAWLLGANCVRMMQMMSLQTFDRTYPTNLASNLQLSPLLSCEALRRVAWSALYADTIVDGGRYGFHIVDEKAYRLQLPCDQASFLANETVLTEPLFPSPGGDPGYTVPDGVERAPLDMSAYLLRTAAARRRALHFAFRASHKEQTADELSAELAAVEADMKEVIAALPRRFHYNTDNVFLHRDRLITFILLHILRHNLFIVVGRAALYVYQRDATKADLITQVRRNRISHALPIAGLVSEGLSAGIHFDPQLGVQAYVALEILLFEPRRLAEIDPLIDPKAPELMDMIPHLLAVIRDLADRSEFVKQLHIEAVHRLLRCDCGHLLNEIDFTAFRSEYRLVGQEAAEYDFRDFRWAKLERLRRGARSSTAHGARDEALLEYRVGAETAAPSRTSSPRLDAMDVKKTMTTRSAELQPLPSSGVSEGLALPEGAQSMEEMDLTAQGIAQPWWGLGEPANADQAFSLNWSWMLDESGHPGYQSGDPAMFWNQLHQI